MKFRNLPKTPQEAFLYFKYGDYVKTKDSRITGMIIGAALQYRNESMEYTCRINIKMRNRNTQTVSWDKLVKCGRTAESIPAAVRTRIIDSIPSWSVEDAIESPVTPINYSEIIFTANTNTYTTTPF